MALFIQDFIKYITFFNEKELTNMINYVFLLQQLLGMENIEKSSLADCC